MINPMLCQTGDGKDLKRQGYVAETKFDGTRVLIIKKNGVVKLQNRHGVNYTRRLPEIVAAAEATPGDFTIDGEAVWVNPSTGKVEFIGSQRRCSTQDPAGVMFLKKQFPIVLEAFDLLKFKGEDVTDRPFWKRKQLLQGLLIGRDEIRYVPHRFDLDRCWREVKEQEEEGLVLKDIEGRYQYERSYSWLKIKNWRYEICSVAGYTPGKNARSHFFGALVLRDRNGKYRGCVGSGFSDWELRQVKDVLADSAKVEKPFDIGEPYTAVKTDLRVKVKYYKITKNNGVMRFPVFIKIL